MAPLITVTAYFDRFVDVILGVAIAFELPVVIVCLILFRLVTAGFLLRHSRYAVLLTFAIGAVITPTTDLSNLLMVAVPMCLLFYVGVLGGYLISLGRVGRLPRRKVWVGGLVLTALAAVSLGLRKCGLRLFGRWPFFRFQ